MVFTYMPSIAFAAEDVAEEAQQPELSTQAELQEESVEESTEEPQTVQPEASTEETPVEELEEVPQKEEPQKAEEPQKKEETVKEESKETTSEPSSTENEEEAVEELSDDEGTVDVYSEYAGVISPQAISDDDVEIGQSFDPYQIKSMAWECASFERLRVPDDGLIMSWHVRSITKVTGDGGVNLVSEFPDLKGGYMACCEPSVTSPEGGDWGYGSKDYVAKDMKTVSGEHQVIRVFTEDSIAHSKAEYRKAFTDMRKLIYYMPGAGGWKTHGKALWDDYKAKKKKAGKFVTDKKHGIGLGPHATSIMGITMALQWASERDASESTKGAKALYKKADKSTQDLIDSYLKLVKNAPDPPAEFAAIYVYTNNKQDIWGAFGEVSQPVNVTMHKVPAKTPPANNPNYSLEGATYQLLEEDGTQAMDVDGETECLFITGKDGKAINSGSYKKTYKVSKGKYILREIGASKGYGKAVDVTKDFEDVATDSVVDIESKEPPETAKITLHKDSEREIPEFAKANYSLKDAEYKLLNEDGTDAVDINGNACVFHTSENGDANETFEVWRGKYKVKETKASPGFKIDTDIEKQLIDLTQKKSSDPAFKSMSKEVPEPAYVSLVKKAKDTNTKFLTEAPNNYFLKGAKYKLYSDPQCTKEVMDYDGKQITFEVKSNNGETSTEKVFAAHYYAKEIEAAKGFLLEKPDDNGEYPGVEVTLENKESNPAIINSVDDPTYNKSEIKIVKFDSKGKVGWDELTGAYYQVSYYDIPCWYKEGTIEKIEDLDPATIQYTKPTRKWIFKTRKVDNPDPTVRQAGFDWSNDEAVASVTLDAPVTTAGGVQYKAGDKVTSDPFYEEPSGARILPVGFYTIEEIKAPVGVTRNDKVVHGKIYQPQNGQQALDFKDNGIIRVDYDEPDQTVTISVQKVDAQTGQNVPEGTAGSSPAMKVKELAMQALSDLVLDTRLASFGSLAGAEYNVYFNNDETNVPEIVGTIVTDENGYGELTKRTAGRQAAKGDPLLPGNYFIEEVKASPGYVIDKYTLNGDDTVQVLDREIEVICGYTDDGKPVTKTIGGNYVNEGVEGNVNFTGDEDNEVAVKGNIGSRHVFHARVQGKNVLNFKYTTKSEDAHHETEFSKKDITTGEELPGATLQVINSDNEIVQSWVSTDKPYIIKALPNGTYTLREITAPYGYDIAEDVTFTVEENVIKNRVEMKNKPITVGTQALDEETKSHQGTFGKEETIKDVVKVTGLYKDRVYTLTGVLVDKATGQPMKNAAGEEIKSEPMTFTATGDEMEVEVFFKVDSSEFTKNTTLVAYEYLARAERFREEPYDFPGEEFPKELAKHENPDDEEQTIHYGGIVETVAMDKASKSHNILADQNVTIVDTVKFENLSPKEEYVISGELYDKTTGQLTGIKATKSFVPEAPNGTVEVEFTFDATELKNHDLVAFENIAINGTVFDKHENPDDEAQTVYVPEIFTTATDLETNDHIAYGTETVNVKDSVVYHNLIPGKEYVMNGTLMNKKTGEPVMDDGEEVTASATFTPTEPDGEVELVFTFNGTELLGETVVAFEECTINNVPVAVHADLEDENQSVDIPKIGTKAKLAPKDKEVKDTVMYENLKPGKYVMKGWLVNKKNGKKLKDSDGETEFEITEEHASGKVLVELPVTGYSKLGGYKLTAFEELYYVGEEEDETGTVVETEYIVADHKDKNDKDQIVEIPGIKTGDSKSIFIYGGILFALAVTAFFVRRKRR